MLPATSVPRRSVLVSCTLARPSVIPSFRFSPTRRHASCSVAEDVLTRLFPRDPPSSGTTATLQRFKGLVRGAGPPPSCSALLACEEWHLPLIECALQVVHAATSSPKDGVAAGMRHVTNLLQRGTRVVLLWQAAGSFLVSFGPDSPLPLPEGLLGSLTHMRELQLDGAVLQTGSVFFQLLMPPGVHAWGRVRVCVGVEHAVGVCVRTRGRHCVPKHSHALH